MRLSTKMILLYSVVIAAALGTFLSYTIQSTMEGANKFTAARFANMSASISLDIQQDIDMMRITLETLADNTSFLSALNQYVRDDSGDGKMGTAARTAALQQLYQSPLVDRYYCVAFFNDQGQYFSSSSDKDSEQPDTRALLDALSAIPGTYLLSPNQQLITLDPRIQVYGLIKPIFFHGKLLGYLAALSEISAFDHVLTFIDNSSEVNVEVFTDDGALFYSSRGQTVPFPLELPQNEMQDWADPETQTVYNVLHTYLHPLSLHLYILQDNSISVQGQQAIIKIALERGLLIELPALVLITLLSLSLTRSIRRLTQKVRKTSSKGLLLSDPAALEALNHTVTSPRDKEIYALEIAYIQMMAKLRENAVNELALREGALQAQLSALQTQINPHFIYNTLNIISAKSMESGNLEIIEICSQFASMLRYSTDTRSRTATLEEEIENVRDYLMLAKARYEDNLEYVIDVPRSLYGIEIPKLTLQPLVENALNHGFDGKNILRKLSIIGTLTQKELILTIRDNGNGFSADMLHSLRQRIDEIEHGLVSIEKSGGHIGLVNTCLRLYYYSKGTMHMSIHNDSGAVITLTMPIQ